MNIYSMIKRGVMIFSAGVLFSLSSCMDEELIDSNSTSEPKKVTLDLTTDTGMFLTPTTRNGTANESGYDASNLPVVLVFKTTGSNYNNATFVEKVTTTSSGADKFKAAFTPTVAGEKVRLLMIANPPTSLATLTAGTTTYTQAIAALKTANMTNPQATVPYAPNGYIPMTGYIDLSGGITTTTTSISKIQLKRVVAKIFVKYTGNNTFTFTGATMGKTTSCGYLFEGNTPTSTGSLISYTEMTLPVSKSTETNPLYVYESAAGDAVVIVKGTYQGTNYFYRIGLKAKDNANTAAKLAVTRNKKYEIEIQNVNCAGYTSLANAVAGTSFSNIPAVVTVTDLSGHEIVDNGTQYLSISNSEFHFYAKSASAASGEVTVATISTNSTGTGQITRVSGPNITFSPTTFTNGTTELKLNLTSALTTSTPLVLRVKTAESLSKEITITRKTQTTVSPVYTLEGSYVQGKIDSGDDLALSTSSTGTNPQTEIVNTSSTAAQTLYLTRTKFDTEPTQNGFLYLFKSPAEEARVKVCIAPDIVPYFIVPEEKIYDSIKSLDESFTVTTNISGWSSNRCEKGSDTNELADKWYEFTDSTKKLQTVTNNDLNTDNETADKYSRLVFRSSSGVVLGRTELTQVSDIYVGQFAGTKTMIGAGTKAKPYTYKKLFIRRVNEDINKDGKVDLVTNSADYLAWSSNTLFDRNDMRDGWDNTNVLRQDSENTAAFWCYNRNNNYGNETVVANYWYLPAALQIVAMGASSNVTVVGDYAPYGATTVWSSTSWNTELMQSSRILYVAMSLPMIYAAENYHTRLVRCARNVSIN